MYVAFLSVKYVPFLPFTYIPFCNLSSYVSFVLFNVPFRDRVVGRGMGVVCSGAAQGPPRGSHQGLGLAEGCRGLCRAEPVTCRGSVRYAMYLLQYSTFRCMYGITSVALAYIRRSLITYVRGRQIGGSGWVGRQADAGLSSASCADILSLPSRQTFQGPLR